MEIAVIVIAACMAILTFLILATCVGMMFLLYKLTTTLKQLDSILHELKDETIPILKKTANFLDEVKILGNSLKGQVHESEILLKKTLKNVSTTSTKITSVVKSFSVIMSILEIFSGYFLKRRERKLMKKTER